MREVKRWPYKTGNGQVIGYTARLEEQISGSKSRKQIIPHFHNNGASGIPDTLLAQHRIYGLDSVLNLSNPIFIVEGEKCTHALHGLGFQALTSLGGCKQGHLADWSVVVGAKCIYLLPDNDDTGREYARNILQHIKGVNPAITVKLLQFTQYPKGDICDFLKTHPTLHGWNELDDLHGHPQRQELSEYFKNYLQNNTEDIPAEWKFIVTKHKHKLITANDFQNLKLPKRRTLLSPWLPEGSITMIFADRGIGKTFFALSCALALANGSEFLCYTAETAVPVLYLDGEMQATAIQERLHKLSKGKTTQKPLSLYTPDCQENDYTPDLGTKEGRDQINELIEAANPKVIFIDNISTFDRTGNENEAESWAPIQEWAIQHRKKGRALVFIHHANKEGKQRGSHKKEDVMDAVIRLKRPDDFVQGEGASKIQVQYTKARHLSGEMAQDIEASLMMEEDFLVWQWEQGDILYRKAVEMMINKISLRDIAEELNLGKSTVHRWKSKAQSERLL